MPFLCQWDTGPGSRSPDPPLNQYQSAAGKSGWRRLPDISDYQAWLQEPCGHWFGPVDGVDCLLLCDGFIVRPRRFDSLASGREPRWLAEALLADGADALRRLEGQYALCFINGLTGQMIAARDRCGGKTLYWHRAGTGVAVASSCSQLARLPGCDAAEDPVFIADMLSLRGRHAVGVTPFRQIRELQPGAHIEVDREGVRSARRPFTPPVPNLRTDEQWVEAFREAFQTAVRGAAGADGNVAVMLSGGMDSVPVLWAAADMMKRDARKLLAVSWLLPGFPDSDESRWIEDAANAMSVPLDSFDAGSLLPFSCLDESQITPELPYYNSVRTLLLECFRRAAAVDCKVVLPATRGDMIYAQRFALLDDLIRRRDWRGFWLELGWLYRRLGLAGMYRDPAIRYPVARIRGRRSGPASMPEWLTEFARTHLPADEEWPPEAEQFSNPAHARQLLGPAMTFGTARENDFARRYGIERRDPFHCEALVSLMLHAPAVLSCRQGQSKWIMREAMKGKLPETMRTKNRTGDLAGFVRAGFDRHRDRIRELIFDQPNPPWSRYVRGDYIERVLQDRDPPEAGVLVVSACIGYTLWRRYWDAVA